MQRFPKTVAFGTGLVSAFAFAPFDLWPLMPVAFAILLALLSEARTMARALGLGWWFGLGQFVVGLNWIATAFTFQAAMPAWLGWVAVALLSLYLAVYPMLATGAAWGLRRMLAPPGRIGGRTLARYRRNMLSVGFPDVALTLFLAASWIVGEWLRATCFTGFAWNPVGVVWVKLLGVAAYARWIGTDGLCGLTVIAGGLLLGLAHRRWRALAPLGLIALGGLLLTPAPAAAPAGPNGPRVRIVQPNIGQERRWQETDEAANRARLVALTGRPEAAPRLLLWPESAVPQFLENDPDARAALAALLGPHDILVTGGVALVYDRAGSLVNARNSVFAIDPRGDLLGRYDKAHLVPYGEYLPMRPLLSAIGLSRLAPGDLDFLPGPGPRTMNLPGFGPVGFQLCYEMIFSGHVVDEGHRPRFVFNPSNDAWFGRWGPPQHLAQARLRAIEEAMPIVRATPTGVSAIIAPDGRLLASLPWKTAGAIERTLPAPLPPTLFAHLGNILPMALAALLFVAAIASAGWRR